MLVFFLFFRGRRGGLVSHFLLAVAVDEPDQSGQLNKEDALDLDGDDEEFHDCNESYKQNTSQTCASKKTKNPKTFYSFSKVGSGYTYKGKTKQKDK